MVGARARESPRNSDLEPMRTPLLFLLAVAAIVACDSPRDTTASVPETADKEHSAEANYTEYCASCHGQQCADFVQREWIYGNSWMEVWNSIIVGYPQDGMAAFGETFTTGELTDLTHYVMNAQEDVAFEAYKNRPRELQTDWKTEALEFEAELVADELEVPWGMAFLPDGSMLVTERVGRLTQISPEGQRTEIIGVPQVVSRGQGGMLDVELHPDYARNGWVYLSYSKAHPTQFRMSTTAVERGRIVDGQWVDAFEIFEAYPYDINFHHYGSRLKFDQEGSLWITVGERGKRDVNPQDLSRDCGKLHRVLADGRPHPGNPYFGEKDKRETIYSYGHRNPQGLSIHPETGQVWEHEHGPRGGDEINKIQPGVNYGWPVISYGVEYNGNHFTRYTEWTGMEQPVHYWVPSIGPCGLEIVRSDRYPEWQGNFLVGSLSFEYLERCVMEGEQVVHREQLLSGLGRVREIETGPDGYLYVAAEGPGRVIRLLPKRE